MDPVLLITLTFKASIGLVFLSLINAFNAK